MKNILMVPKNGANGDAGYHYIEVKTVSKFVERIRIAVKNSGVWEEKTTGFFFCKKELEALEEYIPCDFGFEKIRISAVRRIADGEFRFLEIRRDGKIRVWEGRKQGV